MEAPWSHGFVVCAESAWSTTLEADLPFANNRSMTPAATPTQVDNACCQILTANAGGPVCEGTLRTEQANLK